MKNSYMRSGLRILAYLILLLASLPSFAQISIYINAPGSQVKPGEEFTISIFFHSNNVVDLGQYDFKISLDKNLFDIMGVKYGNYEDLKNPSLNLNPLGNDFIIKDTNIHYGGVCLGDKNNVLALITLRVKKDVPLGISSSFNFLKVKGYPRLANCNGQVYTNVSYSGSSVTIYNYEETTTHLQQYLDVNADANWSFDEADLDYMSQLLGKYKLNVENQNQVKLGGIQMDFISNARPDYYDLAYGEAVTRPTRFISAGANGICNTTAAGDDVQIIPLNNGAAYAIAILPGANNVINTTPGGDDTRYGQTITTGPNGVCNTTASGDDVQQIPVNQGQSYAICIGPGANGYLNTTISGDDTNLNMNKDSGGILQDTKYQPTGRIYNLERITPEFSYLAKAGEIPVLVRLVDEYGNPKSGISPYFEIVSGNGMFKDNRGYSTYITGLPADKFLNLGNPPYGAVGGVVYMPLGETLGTVITATVNPDPAKGILNALSLNFVIRTPATAQPAPYSLTVDPSVTTTLVGSPLQVNFQVKDNSGQGLYGYSKNLKLMTDRNLTNGELLYVSGERPGYVDFDDFSGGLGNWNNGCGLSVTTDTTGQGWFEPNTVKFTGPTDSSCYIQRDSDIGYKYYIKVAFQYKFDDFNDIPENSKLTIKYYNPQIGWVELKTYDANALSQAEGIWLWDEFDLSGNSSLIDTLSITIAPVLDPNDRLYIDNFTVTGFDQIFKEGFENLAVGSNPCMQGVMDYSAYINTGPDGIRQSNLGGDDIANMNLNNGLPNTTAILRGANKSLNTWPLGDDCRLFFIITTGPNGICETPASGDDFQLIPVSKGEPFTIAILPGQNGDLESGVNGDDELINPIGPQPRIEVGDSSTMVPRGGANNTNRFLLIGRQASGTLKQYMVEKRLNLGEYKYVYLTFYSRTYGMSDPSTQPRQEFVCEVSDDGGKTWVPVWDFEGVDHDWTFHRIQLHGDPRFRLVDNFIIRWRASMDHPESGEDAAYIDEILVYGSKGEPDSQTSEVYDNGDGSYMAYIRTYKPGTFKLATVYSPETLDPINGFYPKKSPDATITVNTYQIDPRTVKIIPENFKLDACERLNYTVIGKRVGYSTYTDLTNLFRLDIHGPARMVSPGVIQAECNTGGTTNNYYVRAIPLVPGLTDPEGGGSGVQTGVISGRIFKPNLSGAGSAAVQVKIDANNKIYGKTDSDGFYMFSAVPAGTGYSVIAIKSGYTKTKKDNINLTAGTNKTVDLVLDSGNDCDGDGTLDGADTDDDNEGFSDAQETAAGTDKCNWDSDGDGYADNVDKFPMNVNEWLDTDNDGIGDNTDTDDDGDGLSDTEENTLGSDGYITNPLNPDTDGGGRSDGAEYSYGTDPTNPSDDAQTDSDGDGLTNNIETNTGGCGISWSQLDTKSNPYSTDSDSDGLGDYAEVKTYGTNPKCADTDGDTENDNKELSNYSSCSCVCMNPLVADTDGDGLNDGVEDADHDNTLDPGETDPCNPDTDGDSMPDGWEVTYGLNPRLDNASADSDSDGLNNLTEYLTGTYPNDSDSDDDTMNDGWEYTYQPYTNPLNGSVPSASADPDADGLTNYQESLAGTNPQSSDTDGDNMPDGWEVNNGLDPLVANGGSDPDSDGLTNYQEYLYGTYPLDSDSDDDGLNDRVDYYWGCGGQMNPDTDGDTLLDGTEDADHDGVLDSGETSPCLADTDGGGERDDSEISGGRNPRDNRDDRLTRTIGTGTSSWQLPFATYWHDARTQVIYGATAINACGDIKSIALDVTTVPGQTMNNFTIRLKHTTLSNYTAPASWEGPSSGWTIAYQQNTTISSTGWYTFNLPNRFWYNGTNNLMVDFSFNNSSWSQYGYARYTATSNYRSLYYYTDSGYGDPLNWSGTTNPDGNEIAQIPNIKIVIAPDTDQDGLSNELELANGGIYNDPDTDDDSLLDGVDYYWGCGGLNDTDADNDGIPDGTEDADHDGVLDSGETSPCLADTDGGGESDSSEISGGRDPNDPIDDWDTVTIGTGTGTWNYPLRTNYHDARTQVIYLASQVGTAGSIKKLKLYVTQTPGQTMNNFTIRMKHFTGNSYPPNSWEGPSSGWTTVYQANTTISSTGWYTFNLTTPFLYNGTSNLLVDYSFNNSSFTSDGLVQYTNTGVNRSLYYCTDSGYGDPLNWSGTSNPTPNVSTYIPNIQLVIEPDTDGDGLTDVFEARVSGTNYNDPDTDDDGLPDGVDYNWGCGGANDNDADNDGILDGAEDIDHDGVLDAGESSPCIVDTDSDGISDTIEVPGCSNPNSTDSDGDGLADGVEDANHNGYRDGTETDLCLADTDSDGIGDHIEVPGCSDPLSTDSDGDGLADGVEDANHNGYRDGTETDLCLADTDGDLINDNIEVPGCSDPLDTDSDGDGLEDGEEDIDHNGARNGLETDLCNANTDEDIYDFNDGWEVLYGFDPLDPDDPVASADPDSDGLTNQEEASIGTNPIDPDTDNDDMPDGWEVNNSLLPLVNDASEDPDGDGRRNLDEYLRGFDPNSAEPCGGDKYGAACFVDADGNSILEPMDLALLYQLLGLSISEIPEVIPSNGDGLDADGNGILESIDFALLYQLLGLAFGPEDYLDGQADRIIRESSATVSMKVGEWTEIEMSLESYLEVKRSGYGIIFYIDSKSGGGDGELWGGDGSAVPIDDPANPPETYPSGSRYCITGEMDPPASGKASIWFKATSAGTVVIKAGVPANANKHTQAVGPSDAVTITITNP